MTDFLIAFELIED